MLLVERIVRVGLALLTAVPDEMCGLFLQTSVLFPCPKDGCQYLKQQLSRT